MAGHYSVQYSVNAKVSICFTGGKEKEKRIQNEEEKGS